MMRTGVRSRIRAVLLVVANADLRKLHGNAMRESGLFVHEAATVREALACAEDLRPDLVVLARHLPDGDGWKVARAFKASERMRRVPIVAFTPHRERSDIEGALVAGCDAFLDQACTPDSLVRHVRGMLDMPLDITDAHAVMVTARARRGMAS